MSIWKQRERLDPILIFLRLIQLASKRWHSNGTLTIGSKASRKLPNASCNSETKERALDTSFIFPTSKFSRARILGKQRYKASQIIGVSFCYLRTCKSSSFSSCQRQDSGSTLFSVKVPSEKGKMWAACRLSTVRCGGGRAGL